MLDTLLHLLGVCGDNHAHFDFLDLFGGLGNACQYAQNSYIAITSKIKSVWKLKGKYQY